jgi:hypothetical protein
MFGGRNDNYDPKKKSTVVWRVHNYVRKKKVQSSGRQWEFLRGFHELLVVVSVCVVFCVLCCLQSNPVFSSVTIISHILKNENNELCFLAGFFVNQNYNQKKLRPEKKGWNKSQITICRVKIQPPTG